MITKWKLTNFRSIKDETVLDLAPLTVFTGANSSGKSSFLKSILLISQTLSHKDSSAPLLLNGRFIKLGDFDGVVNDQSGSNTIRIGWECVPRVDVLHQVNNIMATDGRHYAKSPRAVNCEIIVDQRPEGSTPDVRHDGGFVVSGVTLGPLRVSSASDGSIRMKEEWLDVADRQNIGIALSYDIADEDTAVGKYLIGYIGEYPPDYQVSAVGCILDGFLPSEIVLGERWSDMDGQPVARLSSRPLSHDLADDRQYMIDYFSRSVYYLGPLRANPKRVYARSSHLSAGQIDLKGEHTADILETNRDRIIRYIPSAALSLSEDNHEPIECSLLEALIDWIGYLGIAESIMTVNKGKYGIELGVTMENGVIISDLTQVGVGVSQVLPILVTALLAEPDTTLIFEQPELHLHPKVQSCIADFFLSMTLLGKQCLVETHSEHFINRIRLRIAEAPEASSLRDATSIYFVEKEQGWSSFREIQIDEYGGIQVWPEGFFDEQHNETARILRAASLKSKKDWKDN